MNFKGHFTGGTFVGAVVTAGASIVSQSLQAPLGAFELLQVFVVTQCFALFPDLDISSIPQRWFFRGIFLLLCYLGYHEEYEIATLIALIAVTPLLDHHRSWTHHYFSAFLFPLGILALYEYFVARESFFQQLTLERYGQSILEHMWLIIACSAGWVTHLVLDTRLKKRK